MPAFSTNQEALIHDRILESFDEFASDKEGFKIVMGGKERVATRLAGKRMERSEKEERSESGERHGVEIERKKEINNII